MEIINKPAIEDILPRAKNISGRPSYVCPGCGNGSGRDGTGMTEDPSRPGNYHCFKCGFDGDIFDIMDIKDGKPKGSSYKEAYIREHTEHTQDTQNIKNNTPDLSEEKTRAYIEKCAAAISGSPGEEYLKARGISGETIKAFNLGYDAARNGVVIPYGPGAYYTLRSLDPNAAHKYEKPTGLKEPLFNAGDLRRSRVFITEGQIDALSIIQSGGAAVAIGGGGYRKLEEYQGAWPDRVYIAADNDDAGEHTARNIKSALTEKGIAAFIVHPPKDCKDVNDFLIKDPAKLAELVAGDNWLKEEYAAETCAAAHIKAFWNSIKNRREATPTGFKTLDGILDGGLIDGVYIIGARPSTGKTTLCLQLADQISGAGHDVIYFSLEMAQNELIAKSISRLTFLLCGTPAISKTEAALRSPACINNLSQEEKALIKKATEQYRSAARHLWINEGLGTIGTAEIRSALEIHREATGNTPIIIIDYFQLLKTPDPRISDKQAADRNIFEIKRISRDFEAPIVLISSLNRGSYNTVGDLSAVKESGGLEYSCDFLAYLEPPQLSQDEKENREIWNRCSDSTSRSLRFSIVKNRHGSRGKVLFDYYARFNLFEESSSQK